MNEQDSLQKKKALKKAKRLLLNLQSDLLTCKANITKERDAELLKAHLKGLKRGQVSVQVTDYFDENLATKILTLDPRLSPTENITKWFTQAQKSKRGLKHIEPRIREVESTILKLEEENSLLEPISASPPKKRVKPPERKPYHVFHLESQTTAFVGKTARDNEALTFRFAKGNDIWLHAKDVAGSHVILATKKEALTLELLLDAATLAAHYSKAKSEDRVEVVYTEVKHIRRIKNAPAGRVQVLHPKTIFVQLDQTLIKQLLDSKQS